MNPRLTPAARRLRTEIICRPGTLFTHARPYRDLNPGAPLIIDPYGDAAHLIAALRARADTPSDADRLLTAVVDSLPDPAMDDLNVTREALREALREAEPAQPIYEW
jgi:hypothetical protein